MQTSTQAFRTISTHRTNNAKSFEWKIMFARSTTYNKSWNLLCCDSYCATSIYGWSLAVGTFFRGRERRQYYCHFWWYLFRRSRFIHWEAPAVAVAARVNNPTGMYADTQIPTSPHPTPSPAVQITSPSQHCLSAFVFSASLPLFPSHVQVPAEPRGPGLKRCRDEGQR